MLLVLGLRNGERVDIVATAGEQADDASKHAGLIVDENRERVRLELGVRGRRHRLRTEPGAGVRPGEGVRCRLVRRRRGVDERRARRVDVDQTRTPLGVHVMLAMR